MEFYGEEIVFLRGVAILIPSQLRAARSASEKPMRVTPESMPPPAGRPNSDSSSTVDQKNNLHRWQKARDRQQTGQLTKEELTGLVWLNVVERNHPSGDNTLVTPVAKRYACRNGTRALVINVEASNHAFILICSPFLIYTLPVSPAAEFSPCVGGAPLSSPNLWWTTAIFFSAAASAAFPFSVEPVATDIAEPAEN
jgi:hypothetical protein